MKKSWVKRDTSESNELRSATYNRDLIVRQMLLGPTVQLEEGFEGCEKKWMAKLDSIEM